MMGALVGAPMLTACATTDDIGTTDPQYNTSLIEDGVYTLEGERHWDVDVAGNEIYAVNPTGRTSLDVFDLATREFVRSIPANPDYPPVEMDDLGEAFEDYVFNPRFQLEGVQADPARDDIIVWGERDEHFTLSDGGFLPLPPMRKSFVIQSLSPDGAEVNWSLSFDLRGAYRSASVPTLSVYVQEGTIALAYSQSNGPSFVATYPEPEEGHQTLQLIEDESVALPVAEYASREDVEVIRGLGSGLDDGAFTVAASDGLFSLDGGLQSLAKMTFADDFYVMDARTVGDAVYAVDLNGYLYQVSAADGSLRNTYPLEVEGRSIDVEGSKLIIADIEAFQVLDLEDLPEPLAPAPADDDADDDETLPSDDDDDDDDAGGWCWWWWC